MNKLSTQLHHALPHLDFKTNYPLAPHSYFKIGGPAEIYFEAESIKQLQEVLKYCHLNKVKYTLLGGASNVLISDQGISGLVLRFTANHVHLEKSLLPTKHQLLYAESGIKTALLVSKSISFGLTGLESFLGVPGTLGGAIYNNSHYLDSLIGDRVHQIQVLTPDNSFDHTVWLSNQECNFSYDYSRFHHTNEVITAARFALIKGDQESSKDLVAQATQYRAKTQPLGEASSGCIFQNTPNTESLRTQFPQFADRDHIPTGFLIDQAGLKGTRIGSIKVSEKHAAWFINLGNGSSDDVLELIKFIKNKIHKEFGAEIKEEVFFLE